MIDDSAVSPATIDRLRTRLAGEAAAEGLLDLGYATVPTSFGPLLVVASETGLVRVAFDLEDHDAVLASLARRVSPRLLRAPARLAFATEQIADYLDGSRRDFDLPLDLRLARGFRRQVLDHLREIGYGRTESYAQVALATGSPRAVRAVGTACATNPLPIVVPCHRVVRSDGAIGQYLGGTDVKRLLLAMEAA
jgi:methylated-DNA-[protein]-cysteine S-methyltransferase